MKENIVQNNLTATRWIINNITRVYEINKIANYGDRILKYRYIHINI